MHVAGVDEAGRGPLAGPVTVAAVILDPDYTIAGLADSKQLSASAREKLASDICDHALAFSIIQVDTARISSLNILGASLWGMQQSVLALNVVPNHVMVDGNRCPELPMSVEAIVKGDAKHACISAASILAKTARDRYMRDLARQYPQYGFDQHMGYPTAAHMAALREHGPCHEHRRDFAPVANLMQMELQW